MGVYVKEVYNHEKGMEEALSSLTMTFLWLEAEPPEKSMMW